MSRFLMKALALATLELTTATAGHADPAPVSSLGLAFFDAEVDLSSGASRGALRLTGDYRISPAHGLQFGLSGADMPKGWLGRVEGHLYLQPQADRKYGFYAAVADADGRSMTLAEGGIEAMWAPQAGVLLQGRAGAGIASHGIDYLAASGRVERQIGDRLAVFAGLNMVKVDEAGLGGTLVAADLGVRYAVPGSALALSLAVSGDRIIGRDAQHAESRATLGLTWRLGEDRASQSGVDSRAFETINAVDPMIRRGMF